jgi:hypothetical protein
MLINIGQYSYRFFEGEWFWKANEGKIFKKDGTLTKRMHDLPAYKAIYGIEDAVKKEYDKIMIKGVKEIIQNIASSTTK